ncbi:MAG: DinB family protein [Planctomycetaceae bacterium]|nr:DinB family protein [Planctomycetaceae bacterium]
MSLPLALQQIEFARNYTLSIVNEIDQALWFTMPPGCPTHVAWQVGHLAMAQYGLCLFRLRGRQEIDLSLMTSGFRKLFSRGSAPQADAAKYPSAVEIRATLDRVHAQVLKEAPGASEAQLAEAVEMPYAVHANKLGCLLFCSHHEMLHAGQLGLLRRLLGQQPLR